MKPETIIARFRQRGIVFGLTDDYALASKQASRLTKAQKRLIAKHYRGLRDALLDGYTGECAAWPELQKYTMGALWRIAHLESPPAGVSKPESRQARPTTKGSK